MTEKSGHEPAPKSFFELDEILVLESATSLDVSNDASLASWEDFQDAYPTMCWGFMNVFAEAESSIPYPLVHARWQGATSAFQLFEDLASRNNLVLPQDSGIVYVDPNILHSRIVDQKVKLDKLRSHGADEEAHGISQATLLIEFEAQNSTFYHAALEISANIVGQPSDYFNEFLSLNLGELNSLRDLALSKDDAQPGIEHARLCLQYLGAMIGFSGAYDLIKREIEIAELKQALQN